VSGFNCPDQIVDSATVFFLLRKLATIIKLYCFNNEKVILEKRLLLSKKVINKLNEDRLHMEYKPFFSRFKKGNTSDII
jgi:hypothetical protein